MRKIFLVLSSVAILLSSCDNKPKENAGITQPESSIEVSNKDIKTGVITKEEQDKLTPDIVLNMLKAGNRDYVKEELTILNSSKRIKEAVAGQFPKAAIVSCLDSRVPVEDIFHQGIGDLFVARVAGNFVNTDILGSLE